MDRMAPVLAVSACMLGEAGEIRQANSYSICIWGRAPYWHYLSFGFSSIFFFFVSILFLFSPPYSLSSPACELLMGQHRV